MSAARSAATPLAQTAAPAEDEWTDEELIALSEEAEAEPGESVDGRAFFNNLLADLRQRTEAAR